MRYKTIEQIRRLNAQRLVAEAGGVSKVVELFGRAQSQVSLTMGPSASKRIGDRLARRIEAAFERPTGWLDHLHPDETEEAVLQAKITDLIDEHPDEKPEALARIIVNFITQ